MKIVQKISKLSKVILGVFITFQGIDILIEKPGGINTKPRYLQSRKLINIQLLQTYQRFAGFLFAAVKIIIKTLILYSNPQKAYVSN